MSETADKVAQDFYDSRYTDRIVRDSSVRLRRTFLFQPFIESTDRILDFGCGPGFLLESLPAKTKCGVEISETSRRLAIDRGLDVRATLDEFSGERFDKVISAHALEHVVDPASKLSQMRELLDVDGRLVLLLPMDEWVTRIERKWTPNDPNRHLYTWTPLLIGNLLKVCGFEPIEIKTIHHFLGPRVEKVGRLLGGSDTAMHVCAALASWIKPIRQLLAVGRAAR